MEDRGDRTSASPAPSHAAARGRRRLRAFASLFLIAIVLVAVAAAAAVYTEQPSFCPTCHEMSPYYDAWAVSPHAKASCVECHVDPGLVSRGLHKFVALKEVWDHFKGGNRFPAYTVRIPDSRCLPCHGSVVVTGTPAFSHADHEQKASCAACHPSTGHAVSLDALRSAGILSSSSSSPAIPAGLTPSKIPGHIEITCTRCHDQGIMACSTCHTKAPHKNLGECSDCHRPGKTFVFVHPSSQDCAACHKPPPNHFEPPCTRCHLATVPFARTVFRHPATGGHGYRAFACVKCHPKSYAAVSCTCHGGKVPTDD